MRLKRLFIGVGILLLGSAPLYISVPAVFAGAMANRSITIGTSAPGAQTTYTFQFTIPVGPTLGSIEFLYCENSPVFEKPCTPPSGLSVNTANLASQSGEIGFTIDSSLTSNNRIVLTRVPTATTPHVSVYSFSPVANPISPNKSTFVRINTFASNNATGAYVDRGAVVFAITGGGLGTTGYVPPFLIFCVGVSVQPGCTAATGDKIDLGELRSNAASAGTSQFAGATNDPAGYSVAVLGNSMTSGNNVLSAMSTPIASIPGTSQYGINVRANAAPPVGADRTGVGTGFPTPSYATPNIFAYAAGDTVVSSILPTDFNTFTVSYLVNVPPGQAPGIYATTATYVATAAF